VQRRQRRAHRCGETLAGGRRRVDAVPVRKRAHPQHARQLAHYVDRRGGQFDGDRIAHQLYACQLEGAERAQLLGHRGLLRLERAPAGAA
jgi:hypothetical protein